MINAVAHVNPLHSQCVIHTQQISHPLEFCQYLSPHLQSMRVLLTTWVYCIDYIISCRNVSTKCPRQQAHVVGLGLHCCYSNNIKTIHESALKIQRNRYQTPDLYPSNVKERQRANETREETERWRQMRYLPWVWQATRGGWRGKTAGLMLKIVVSPKATN